MGKYAEPHSGTIELVEQVLSKSFLSTAGITIKVLVDNKLNKKPVKAVGANELLKHETGNDVYLFINEIILDELYNVDNEYPLIAIEEALCGIKYDTDKGTVSTNTEEEVKSFKGVLRKHGFEKYDSVDESIKTLYQVEKDKNKK